ncbi:methionyl-tRNA formyltransferase [Halalkalibaculum sp. DA3122]|uniref:methionyl-tRNA formyltransferase n=1 Tax=Halalkalibaculum sp. DA3122 TaxID=3373607 RepID=UPI0037550D39
MTESNPRIALAGSVNSSRKTLEKLFEHDMNVVGVLGLDPSVSGNVSGFVDLKRQCEQEGFGNFRYFTDINAGEVRHFIDEWRPDYLFVVGLSQLVKEPLLSLPSSGCIGFHPTRLPEGRGRGAVAWLILGKAKGAATFFKMGAGMDDGPILAQQPFEVEEEDYAQDVIDKIIGAIGTCLDELLPGMQAGTVEAREQNHADATYLGKRNPEDGWINWQDSARSIVTLVRAVSSPLPGAFACIKGQKIIIDRASVETELNYIGVAGRILKKDPQKGVLVQAGDGLLWLHELRGIAPDELRVGQQFGSLEEYRFEQLNNKIVKLEKRLSDE